MASDSKPTTRGVVWDPSDIDRIEEVARRRNQRDHTRLTFSDIVRMGTLRFVAEEEQLAALEAEVAR